MTKENIIGDKIQLWYKNGNAYRQRKLNYLLVRDLKLKAILKAVH